jgi:hypothetical protein
MPSYKFDFLEGEEMSRKLNLVSALFTLTLIAIAGTSAMAQIERVKPNTADGIVKPPTLGCCTCLGGTNTLDLSTTSSNNWTVNGNPVVFLTQSQLNQWWNLNPSPASWVSTVATGSTGNILMGTYDYKLKFVVPCCAIEQRVTLSGNYGGDDNVFVYLDNIANANLISQCTGGWCFNTQNPPPPLNYVVSPGPHTLIVRVVNTGASPSGLFVSAKLTGTCRN